MSDNYHLSSNENQHQHPAQQELYTLFAQPSAGSPSTTASPISPMTTIVHQNQSWPSIGQAIDQRHYYYDMNQHPQQQHQLQDQYWPNAYQSYPRYSHFNHPLPQQQHFQQYYSEPMYTPPPPPPPPPPHHHHHQHYQSASTMARSVPTFYTTQQQQPLDNSFNAPMSNIENTFSGPPSALAAPSIDQMQPTQHSMKEKSRQPQKHSAEGLTTSPSPSETPVPSPIISNKRKRRGSTVTTSQCQRKKRMQNDTKDTPKDEGGLQGSHDEGDGDNGVTTTTTTRRADATKDTHSNQTVDQLENELAFLRDECATILIMLDSLRNAFLADIPSTTASTSAAKSNSSSATINFMVESVKTFSSISTPFMQHHVDTSSAATNNGDRRRRSKAMAQNAEMEREMRFAYDDLMLQVRQLEKKVERLEGKSKHVCLEDSAINNNKKKHEEDQIANLKDDIQELPQENTDNDNEVDKTDGDDDTDDSGE